MNIIAILSSMLSSVVHGVEASRYEGFYTDLYIGVVVVVALVLLYVISNPKMHHRKQKVHNAVRGASTGSGTYITLLHGKSIINRGPEMDIPRIPTVINWSDYK